MGGKTSIQINVYRQTSPLPCSVSMSDGCGSPVRGWPQRDAGTQVVPAPAGLFVGWNSCVSCRSDTGWATPVLERVLPSGRA